MVGYESYWLLYAFIAAALACLPASIASRKGKSFGTWWLYGFLLWIVAIIHAISLPEIKSSDAIGLPSVSLTLIDSKENNVFDINSPIHIMGYDLLKDIEDTMYLNVRFQNLNKGTVKAVKLIISGYNSFGESIAVNENNSFAVLLQDINADKYMSFSNDSLSRLPNRDIRRVDIYIAQVCFADGTVIENDANYISPDIELIASPEEKQIAIQYSPSAKCYSKKEKEYWVCTCGYPNIEDNCNHCQLQKDWVIETFNKDNLIKYANTQKEKDRLIKLELEKKAKKTAKNRKAAIIIVSLFALLSISLLILNSQYIQPNMKYKEAVLVLNYGSYDDAKDAFYLLGAFKDSEDMVKECDYQKALKYVSNNHYQEAIDCLKTIENYDKARELLQKFVDEKTGEITKQIEISVNKNLSAGWIYSSKRTEREIVSASVTGNYIKGILQGHVTCTFTGSVYHGTSGGWTKENYKYVGEFTNNTLTGLGTLYAVNNNMVVFSGLFKDGAYSGSGNLYQDYFGYGKIFVVGIWKNCNIEGNYTRYFGDGTVNDTGTCYDGIVNSSKFGIQDYRK